MKLRVAFLLAFAACASGADAQVHCRMPNGVVIEQRLAKVCPSGALEATTPNGAPAKVRGPALAPPEPVTMDKRFVKRQVVSRAEFGAAWPLTVDGGTLRCKFPDPDRPQLHALLIEVGADTYALNGVASTHAARNGWRDVKEVWRDNPHLPGTKVPVSPLLERAEVLCR